MRAELPVVALLERDVCTTGAIRAHLDGSERLHVIRPAEPAQVVASAAALGVDVLIIDLPAAGPADLALVRGISARARNLAIVALIDEEMLAFCEEIVAAGADGILASAGFNPLGLRCAVQAAAAQRSRGTADAANRAKSAFLGNMSHEFRTPLNAVLGFSEMMCTHLHGPLGAKEYEEYALYIHGAGRRLLALVDNLIDMARIEAGDFRLAPGYVDLAKVAHAVIAAVSDVAGARDVRVEPDVEERLEATRLDEVAARKAVLNVLANAIDFTGRGGKVFVRAKRAGKDRIEIMIVDEGRGIPPEQLQRVLEPFQQGDVSLTREHGGAGLGLSIATRLMEMQGGTLSIRSRVGVGTTVILSFPRA